MADERRVYYDHEPAYRAIAEAGGEGWDDLTAQHDNSGLRDERFGSYDSLTAFLDSERAPAPTRALELGCGGGQACMLLAARGFEAVGVDYSETAVELARANAERRGLDCTFHRGDVLDLAFVDDASFGFVVDNHCLHCLITDEDRAAALGEARRVLGDGGLFFCETMSSEGHYTPETLGVDRATGIDRHRTRRFVTEAHLRSELAAAGFEVIELTRVPQEPHTGDCLVVVATPIR